ncbi:hypothetical protein K7X08_011814 [Anisodus acutangulus]|uniref:glutaredoxin-dependent peroxiredoxin n=1 Tax=Anisodus acutangulus TaxID=402998 RepID=A0A9Q1MNT1_9SOLA|nr:hypothetical protein K7X08_011814 [Anisodus acutangulus]
MRSYSSCVTRPSHTDLGVMPRASRASWKAVNDPFVMKAWAKTYPENKHVKFFADGAGKYTHALGLELDLSEKGLGVRSRRYALLVNDLAVKVANIESEGEFTVSGADEILKAL